MLFYIFSEVRLHQMSIQFMASSSNMGGMLKLTVINVCLKTVDGLQINGSLQWCLNQWFYGGKLKATQTLDFHIMKLPLVGVKS